MKARIITKKDKKTLMEIISELINIQNNTDHCVFFRYSGHTNQIDIEIAKTKKEYNCKIFEKKREYLDPPIGEDLKDILEELKEISKESQSKQKEEE